MRDELINGMATALRADLETWAREKNILQPGERLAFSLRVEQIPTIVREGDDMNYLDMRAVEFFTYERFLAIGVHRQTATRYSRAVEKYIRRRLEDKGEELINIKTTVRDFIKGEDRTRFDYVCGKGGKQAILAVLAAVGITP